MNGQIKKLLVTFDYELFLGKRSGKVDSCLIIPTNKILKVVEEYGLKAIFFVDTTHLLKLKEYSNKYDLCKRDLERIEKQILQMIDKGCYVYPHIHPHWLDAEYILQSNEWNLTNIKRYRFEQLQKSEQHSLFSESHFYLTDLIRQHNPTYNCDMYRAGGWSLQPFENFETLFRQYGYTYESSVLSGFYSFTKAQYFDFSIHPSKPIYRFEEDPCKEVMDGTFVEFTNQCIEVSTQKELFNRFWIKLLRHITKDHGFGRGVGQNETPTPTSFPASKKGIRLGGSNHEYISIENMSAIKNSTYKEFFNQHDYMMFVSHPKMVTNHNLYCFRRFIESVSHKHLFETDFKRMI